MRPRYYVLLKVASHEDPRMRRSLVWPHADNYVMGGIALTGAAKVPVGAGCIDSGNVKNFLLVTPLSMRIYNATPAQKHLAELLR